MPLAIRLFGELFNRVNLTKPIFFLILLFMPKVKTLKSLANRIAKKKRKTLKLHIGYRHLLAKKSGNRKRQNKDRKEGINKSDLKRIRKII